MSDIKVGDLIEQAHSLREQIRADEKALNVLKEDLKQLSLDIMSKMDEVGVDRLGGRSANVSIAEQEVPTVKDWDAVYDFIKSQDAFYLLQKRMSAAAFRELMAMGTTIPGVEVYKDRKLNLRAI
jgi:hypothetical protein